MMAVNEGLIYGLSSRRNNLFEDEVTLENMMAFFSLLMEKTISLAIAMIDG